MRAVESEAAAGGAREIQDARGTASRRPETAPQRRAVSGQCSIGILLREVATAFREIEVLAPDTVSFTRDTMPEAYRLIRVLYRFINPD